MQLNSPLYQAGNHQVGGAGSAVMYLFSPRHFSNQARRPLVYNFDTGFTEQALNAVEHSIKHRDKSRLQAFTANPTYLRAVVPSFQPDFMVNMGQLSEMWTFMLVINNDKRQSQYGVTQAMADNIQLYYGYFLSEPVNPVSHMGKVTPNPNAQLMITHKTIVQKLSTVNAYGTSGRHDTMADIDVIPSQTMAAISSQPVVMMLPQNLYKNVSVDPDGTTSVMHPESNLLGNQEASLDVYSKLSVPKTNIGKVLDAIADTQMSIQVESYSGRPTMELGSNDTFTALLTQNLGDYSKHVDYSGPQTNTIVTLGAIIQRYNPTITPINLPRGQLYATQDQSIGSARTVFSAMLANVVPAMMPEFLIAQVSFRYDTFAEVSGAKDYEITSFAMMTAISEIEKKNRIQAFMFRLKKEVFSILKLQHGDFNLNMNCDVTSVTHITLNFYADSVASPEVFEIPTLLGGINNPLVGTANVCDHNSREIGSFISCIYEDDRDAPPLGSYDMNAYANAVHAYDRRVFANNTGNGPLLSNGVPEIKLPKSLPY